jgi:hypothetical protein
MSKLLTLALSLFVLVAPTVAEARGPVSVRGYTRKDGTYVRPHMRSAPDGVFGNNWSTYGNVNPYTGVPGTKRKPPSSSTRGSTSIARAPSGGGGFASIPSGAPPSGREASRGKERVASERRKPDGSGPYPTTVMANAGAALERQKIADEVREYGAYVKWREHSLSEMQDVRERCVLAYGLRHYGARVNWEEHTVEELEEFGNRLQLREYLRGKGVEVDWRRTSSKEMMKRAIDIRRGVLAAL